MTVGAEKFFARRFADMAAECSRGYGGLAQEILEDAKLQLRQALAACDLESAAYWQLEVDEWGLELLRKLKVKALQKGEHLTVCDLDNGIDPIQHPHAAIHMRRSRLTCYQRGSRWTCYQRGSRWTCDLTLPFHATQHDPSCSEPNQLRACRKVARGDAMRVVRKLDDGTPVGATVVVCGQNRYSRLTEVFTGARFLECCAHQLVRVADHDWTGGPGAAHTGEYRMMREGRGWLLNGAFKGNAIKAFCGFNCAHGGDLHSFFVPHFSCCGQRSFDSPCECWVATAPLIGVRDRVRHVKSGEYGIVLGNFRSPFPLCVYLESSGLVRARENELLKVPSLLCEIYFFVLTIQQSPFVLNLSHFMGRSNWMYHLTLEISETSSPASSRTDRTKGTPLQSSAIAMEGMNRHRHASIHLTWLASLIGNIAPDLLFFF